MRTIVIIGATSGIGRALARYFDARGWRVAITGRRENLLTEMAPPGSGIIYSVFDITAEDAGEKFAALADALGDVTDVVHCAGCGWMNPDLDPALERRTVMTNAVGFATIIDAAYRWFRSHGIPGHISAITSVAGTKGIGLAPAYSATKRFGTEYLTAIQQLANQQKTGITVTDIRPGFIATDLLSSKPDAEGRLPAFPMLMTLDHAVPLIARAIERHPHTAVIDLRWRILTALWRRLPLCIWRRLRLSVPRK